MNGKNRMIAWTVGVVTIVVVLMVVIVALEPPGDRVSRAQAFKAMALALTTKADCEAREEARQTSYFSAKEKNNWFVKYMDYLYEEGYLDPELTPPTLASAQGDLTYAEASHMAACVAGRLRVQVGANRHNEDSYYPADEWRQLYARILEQVDPEGNVKTVEAILYGTPSNLPEAESWTAYTTEGNFGFQGLALDAYLDCEIRFLARDGEMIAFTELVSREVVYENVWLSSADEKSFTAYLGTACREFPVSGTEEEQASLSGNLADLYLDEGKLTRVTIKKDRIGGKVLSVTDSYIEIEGYGQVPLSPSFHVYKTYGDFQVLGAEDILVGYDLQEFVAADGELCAALLEREFDARTIRVLLMDTGFGGIFHPQADITLNTAAALTYENSSGQVVSSRLEAGESLTVQPGDERLACGRLTITPEGGEGITIRAIERGQGNPTYSGSLEIRETADGLTLVNDLYLEDYLTKVVPSEMPPSYEMEALKAQAVCARTYAYRQILGNAYSQYGAHVDDSTNFQVYNNTNPDARTDQAVNETYGKMLFYSGEPAQTFYYSTSCGRGTDGSVWGSEGAALPYLKAKEIQSGGGELTEGDNENFPSYIQGSDPAAYESSFAMFRWETDIPAEVLTAQISGAGEVTGLIVTSRGAGGIAQEVTVTGSQGSVAVTGQSAIRSSLGNSALVIRRQDGSEMTGSAALPSAFIAVDKRMGEDGKIVFHIYGGGYGHGVGMSQNGAQGMAASGASCEEILRFFYEGTELKEITGGGTG